MLCKPSLLGQNSDPETGTHSAAVSDRYVDSILARTVCVCGRPCGWHLQHLPRDADAWHPRRVPCPPECLVQPLAFCVQLSRWCCPEDAEIWMRDSRFRYSAHIVAYKRFTRRRALAKLFRPPVTLNPMVREALLLFLPPPLHPLAAPSTSEAPAPNRRSRLSPPAPPPVLLCAPASAADAPPAELRWRLLFRIINHRHSPS